MLALLLRSSTQQPDNTPSADELTPAHPPLVCLTSTIPLCVLPHCVSTLNSVTGVQAPMQCGRCMRAQQHSWDSPAALWECQTSWCVGFGVYG